MNGPSDPSTTAPSQAVDESPTSGSTFKPYKVSKVSRIYSSRPANDTINTLWRRVSTLNNDPDGKEFFATEVSDGSKLIKQIIRERTKLFRQFSETERTENPSYLGHLRSSEETGQAEDEQFYDQWMKETQDSLDGVSRDWRNLENDDKTAFDKSESARLRLLMTC